MLFEKGVLQIRSKFLAGTPIQMCHFHICRLTLKNTSGDLLLKSINFLRKVQVTLMIKLCIAERKEKQDIRKTIITSFMFLFNLLKSLILFVKKM